MIINQFKNKYGFLSNFAALPFGVLYEGILFPTSEHAYQAAKTTDMDLRRRIAAIDTPGKAKRFGQTIHPRDEWDDEMFRCLQMYRILQEKFSDPDLRKQLLETGDAELIEGNYWNDMFWGVCLKTKQGKNHLGRLLMKLRKTLQEEEVAKPAVKSAAGPQQLELDAVKQSFGTGSNQPDAFYEERPQPYKPPSHQVNEVSPAPHPFL